MAKTPDWEAIEAAYRAGLLSIRAIADKYGANHSTILKRAKKHGWQRDLTEKVKSATKQKVTRTVTTNGNQNSVVTDDEIVEAASDEASAVVLGHRKGAVVWKGIADKLAAILGDMEVNETNHNEFARSLNSGVDALGKLIKLERQAYSMDDDDKADETAERSLTDDELEARITELSKKVGSEQ